GSGAKRSPDGLIACLSAARRSEHLGVAGSWRASAAPAGRRRSSSADEARRSPLRGGGDASVEVLGDEQLGLLVFLARGGGADPLGEISAHRLTARPDGQRRGDSDLPAERARVLAHPVACDEPIAKAGRTRPPA